MKLICFIAAAVYVVSCRHAGDGSGDASGRLRMGPGEDRSGKLPMGPPLPYLANVTDEARQQYLDIFSNFNQTVAEQKQGILTWAQKNGILVTFSKLSIDHKALVERHYSIDLEIHVGLHEFKGCARQCLVGRAITVHSSNQHRCPSRYSKSQKKLKKTGIEGCETKTTHDSVKGTDVAVDFPTSHKTASKGIKEYVYQFVL
ncbi:unnamed protein product [Nippostrongylus brasiliensis]|uniref:Secreted protein n=1 Tax=Nippostrongylus brasiliensis TaxID=27835 RepID=A0A0N4XUP0_NIPBR|nr:unnamed protein product [Nippostrongylus brasiliensis]